MGVCVCVCVFVLFTCCFMLQFYFIVMPCYKLHVLSVTGSGCLHCNTLFKTKF